MTSEVLAEQSRACIASSKLVEHFARRAPMRRTKAAVDRSPIIGPAAVARFESEREDRMAPIETSPTPSFDSGGDDGALLKKASEAFVRMQARIGGVQDHELVRI